MIFLDRFFSSSERGFAANYRLNLSYLVHQTNSVFVVSTNSGGGSTAFPDGGPTDKDRSFLQFFHAIFVVGYTDQVLSNMLKRPLIRGD
jgi:hypothetical protein